MITKEIKDLVQWVMEFALKNGCQSSRVTLYNGSSSSFEIRNRKIDRLQQATENTLIIHLFVDGRFGSYSTNRMEKHELERFILEGIAATRFLAEDKARTLPNASLYYKGNVDDLQLMDPKFNSIQPDDKVALVMRVCEEMMGKDDRLISANSSYTDETVYKYLVASNGFEGEVACSSYGLMASASIHGEGDARPESYWYDSSLFFDSLIKEGIGTKALERALRKLGQQKIASGKYTMIVDNMNSSRLLSPILTALNGFSIQQKNSFLLDKLGEKIGSDQMNIMDEPHMPQTPGSRYFDNEGVATKQLSVFDKGLLGAYYIDTYNANKMDVEQTVDSPSVLTMRHGDHDLDGLISSVDKGILVTGFNGGNCNSTTGDFSYGIEGFLIDKGQITQPISEMNATGNMLQLWSNLVEVGNDPLTSAAWRIPSLMFEGVDFSGL